MAKPTYTPQVPGALPLQEPEREVDGPRPPSDCTVTPLTATEEEQDADVAGESSVATSAGKPEPESFEGKREEGGERRMASSLQSSELQRDPKHEKGDHKGDVEEEKESEPARKIFLGGLSLDASKQTVEEHFIRYGELEDVRVPLHKVLTGKSRGFGFVTFKDAAIAAEVVKMVHKICGREVDVKFAVPRAPSSSPVTTDSDAIADAEQGSTPADQRAVQSGKMSLDKDDQPSRRNTGSGVRGRNQGVANQRTTNNQTTDTSTHQKQNCSGSTTSTVSSATLSCAEVSNSTDGSGAEDSSFKIFVGGLAGTVTQSVLRNYFGQFGALSQATVMIDRETNRSRGFGFVSFADATGMHRALKTEVHNINGKPAEVKEAIPRDVLDKQRQQRSQVAAGPAHKSTNVRSASVDMYAFGVPSSIYYFAPHAPVHPHFAVSPKAHASQMPDGSPSGSPRGRAKTHGTRHEMPQSPREESQNATATPVSVIYPPYVAHQHHHAPYSPPGEHVVSPVHYQKTPDPTMDLFAGLANRAESLLEKIDGQAARTADYSDSDEEGDELYYDDEEDYDDEDDDENAKDEVSATRHDGADREGLYKDHERLNDGAQMEHSSSAAWKWEAQRVADRLQSAKRYVARSRAQVQASQSRHIEALEAELRTLDKQMVSMQADLDAAHEALEKSRKGARAQESKLRKERDELLAEAKRKQKELQATIKARDRTISDHEHELGELRGALDEFDADYEELQQKYDAREKEFKDKQREMQQNSQASQVVELEQELAAAQTAAEVARREFSVQVNEAERRIAELEHQNSELSVELAATQRKLDDRDESDWNAQERSALENDHQNALYEAQEAQRHAEEMLAQERRRIAALQQDVDAVHAEAERAASRKAQEEQRWQAESRQLRDQVDALKRDLNAMRKRDDIQGVAALEQRLAALSEHLVAKQKQIESLTSEKGALRQRLKSLERQHEELRLQEQVSNGAGRRGAGTAGYGGDVELGSVSLRFRRRQETAAMRIARLEPIAQHQNLAEAVDVVDQLALSSGAVLQREPWVRLMFLGYFLLLHLWVIFILVFHTHGTVPVEVARYSIPDAREAALPTVGP
ncbi:RNA-binding protein 1 [Hondaea fermentalgiana]|uniref:RNA-binding protein 1 n=1 Tax=Hondaea fermentalgiana TaxID=2315210 RepID=A0A2R5GWZ4_9STRA|nr:RNA-binding protein 1 [Hondaea fermentalgiana]|eukprot:GBG34298.1 RNA-binding protein 1 [Hondaea fermentalgiana]